MEKSNHSQSKHLLLLEGIASIFLVSYIIIRVFCGNNLTFTMEILHFLMLIITIICTVKINKKVKYLKVLLFFMLIEKIYELFNL